MPVEFVRNVAGEEGFGPAVEAARWVAVGNVFFRRDEEENRKRCVAVVEEEVARVGCVVLGWRRVPTDHSGLGRSALGAEPEILQLFVGPGDVVTSQKDFEVRLFILRKRASHRVIQDPSIDAETLPMYICSLSSRTLVYKGMLRTTQVKKYFLDLAREDFKSHVISVHSRFSTNTFPAWSRSHPYRYICHNGEINSRIGNENWMRAREGNLSSDLIGPDLQSIFPIVEHGNSDSQTLDNVLELLVIAGRSLPHSVLMMVPEAWQNSELMAAEKKSFYKFHSSLMEPWDGPALVLFNDGDYVGAVLDRNGLRPCRYYVTRDNRVICGSEAGIVPSIADADIVQKGRLQPGKMLLADIRRQRIVDDAEIKKELAAAFPYEDWIREHEVSMDHVVSSAPALDEKTLRVFPAVDALLDENAYNKWEESVLPLLKSFAYSTEHLDLLIKPMVVDGMEALGSMGNDTPLAFMSTNARVSYDYFKQLFAQVTNPPIDPIRESIVMSLASFIGPEKNILTTTPEHVKRLFLESPILSLEELNGIKNISVHGWSSRIIDITFPRTSGVHGLREYLTRICDEAHRAIEDGNQFIILSDRAVDYDRVPISALLALGAVHHHLVKLSERTQIGIIVESGEPREVHHMCCLLGYGADAICPYLVYACALKLRHDEKVPESYGNAKMVSHLKKSYYKGVLKVMAKMGLSTLQSYKGAQIFEAVGLAPEVIELCFRQTSSRIGGCSLERLAEKSLANHGRGFPNRPSAQESVAGLGTFGEYHWRAGSGMEKHINDPEALAKMQTAVRTDSRKTFAEFTKIHNQVVRRTTLRGLLRFKKCGDAVPLEEVEPPASIVKRFRTGAMSYGSISIESHSTLARAMNRLGAKSNSGEGGEDEERFFGTVGGDRIRSAIKQVASGRFGVTIEYLSNADELQIKMAQGAKPGEGGELPGWKVSEDIAKTRNSTPGVGLISPPPHHDIYSIEDLAQLIYDLKNSNPGANVSVKLVSKLGVGVIASGVTKGKADHILISGHDGGTGASRWTGIKHAGLPWELGIAETHQVLVMNGLRGRVSLETDGHLRSGRDVAIAAMLGAEHFGFGTGPLIALGCIMMRKCHLNTCPVGIATQDPELRKKFSGQPEHVINFFFMIAEELREIMAELGFRNLVDMVGRTDALELDPSAVAESGLTADEMDASRLLMNAFNLTSDTSRHENHKLYEQDHLLDDVLDRTMLATTQRHLERGLPTRMESLVSNTDRAVGAILSHELIKIHGSRGLPDGTIHIKLVGTAGQSVGAWLAKGILIELEGDANDYPGKGLSGGTLVVYPPQESTFLAEEQVIAGNVALYGATSGKAFFRGKCAERFCVRNSGAIAVAEGVGDHGCEYMTGGRTVILGSTGINFAAGMSGGIAYVFDPAREFPMNCNMESVDLVGVSLEDESELKSIVEDHVRLTGSTVGTKILGSWDSEVSKFVKVYPRDYRRVLEERVERASSSSGKIDSTQNGSANGAANGNANGTNGVNHARENGNGRSLSSGLNASLSSISDIEDVAGVRPVVVMSPQKKRGFIEYERGAAKYRDASERVKDFEEIYTDHDHRKLYTQSARCMDCGVPFCQSGPGCPLGNKIPEWNELVHENKWKEALERLLQTNNFPEFTGRVCPAPCEGSCVLGIIEQPVTIKNIECAIIDHAFEQGWMVPRPPTRRTGKRVAIIGSGPAGMAAADQLNKAGHWVTVYERADRVGGLMMYGVPNMKADKEIIVQRRVDLMIEEGVKFITGPNGNIGGTEWLLMEELGNGAPTEVTELVDSFDSVLLATGAVVPRDLKIPGREAKGVYFAMDFLTRNTKALLDSRSTGQDWRLKSASSFIDAKDKRVIVIGGGDTGNDCIGTSVRHGAKSVVNFELLPQPPAQRAADNPWPEWPRIFRVDYGHEEVKITEGHDPREFVISSKEFLQDSEGNLTGVKTVRVEWTKDDSGRWKMGEVPGSEQTFEADLCFLAMGFLGPQKDVADKLSLELDPRGNYKADFGKFQTSLDKVFAAGDCRRGQSLVVWAIAEGRQAAREIDYFLMGDTLLP
uniref:glutamate synthase (NADH) n=1 Tax=Compsopogon caeruleus TaxID=31354 RepID=A0A7S1TF03_9RHOD